MKKWLRWALALALFLVLCVLSYPDVRVRAAAGGNPLIGLRRTFAEGPVQGRVEQRLRAGSYTYLALRTESEALQWAVTLGSSPAVGTRVSARSMGHRTDFYSRKLSRTFPDLMFAIVSRAD